MESPGAWRASAPGLGGPGVDEHGLKPKPQERPVEPGRGSNGV